eukprot:Nk52_evm3s163 gene=Nk52_evmTU3s163
MQVKFIVACAVLLLASVAFVSANPVSEQQKEDQLTTFGKPICLRLRKCQPGTYCSWWSCKDCSAHCTSCTCSKDCSSCEDGYYVKDNKCEKCGPNCDACTGADQCTACADGYVNVDGKCQKMCAVGCSNDGNHYGEQCPVSNAYAMNAPGEWGTCYNMVDGKKSECIGNVWDGEKMTQMTSTYQEKTNNWVIVCPEGTKNAGHWSVISKVDGVYVNSCDCGAKTFTGEFQGYCCSSN